MCACECGGVGRAGEGRDKERGRGRACAWSAGRARSPLTPSMPGEEKGGPDTRRPCAHAREAHRAGGISPHAKERRGGREGAPPPPPPPPPPAPRPRPRPCLPAARRTVFSPMCWATSRTRRTSWPSTSRAVRMGGSSPSSNWTSTTAPMTCGGGGGRGGAGRGEEGEGEGEGVVGGGGWWWSGRAPPRPCPPPSPLRSPLRQRPRRAWFRPHTAPSRGRVSGLAPPEGRGRRRRARGRALSVGKRGAGRGKRVTTVMLRRRVWVVATAPPADSGHGLPCHPLQQGREVLSCTPTGRVRPAGPSEGGAGAGIATSPP